MSPKYELVPSVYWVGAKDWKRRVFHALIPLPQGTSYNLQRLPCGGKKAVALVDTVNPGFEEDLWLRISALVDPGRIDYVIMNHAEPDHAGAIPWVLSCAPQGQGPPHWRWRPAFTILPENAWRSCRRGFPRSRRETLNFYVVPFVHWPETMFTFLSEDRILFPCDFFGAHTAKGFYAEGVPDIAVLAKSYFGEIMMPHRQAARRA